MTETVPSPATTERPKPSLQAIFIAFAKIGVTSFGGGVSGVMHTEFVTNRGWISEPDFLSGLAVGQALPGVNVTNLAIWLGYQCRGTPGAIIAAVAAILPPSILIILLGEIILRISAWPIGGTLLAGVAASALGLSLAMGLRAARNASRNMVCVVILAVTIVGSGFFHLSAIVLVAVLAPIGIGIAYESYRREQQK